MWPLERNLVLFRLKLARSAKRYAREQYVGNCQRHTPYSAQETRCCAKCAGGSACRGFRLTWSHHGKALVEHAGKLRGRLPDVIDYHLTTRHDKLEPTLRIGEDANILQWISLDDEQIGRGSRSYDTNHALHPQ